VGGDRQQALLAAFGQLDGAQQDMLLEFAAFLAVRTTVASAAPVTAPQPEPRPAVESVVVAIKRLTRTYPMLDRRKLMGPTSLLMSQHTLQGRAATAVIDELELVFERHYLEIIKRET
jgi:16S rRNA A1518/A1519 N6-dimethyltransferase RsmA/KsgA/DIM1 with predicted DNA glycosylase/AP lyase activity